MSPHSAVPRQEGEPIQARPAVTGLMQPGTADPMLNKHLPQASEVCGYLLGSITVAIRKRHSGDVEVQGTKQLGLQETVVKDSGLGKCINLCFSPKTPLKQHCENSF